ncbi:hypothetical protein MTBUT4_140040 [Magnetospirillum sp. UT-4]|nr:hypothetical protein MTBUT4_140040 [Magnetospirillum sp. UT-4]
MTLGSRRRGNDGNDRHHPRERLTPVDSPAGADKLRVTDDPRRESPHPNILWLGPAAPKEQPPLETLRQTDRGGMNLWKAARSRVPTDDVSPRPVHG